MITACARVVPRRGTARRSGQAAVEFAVCLPLLVLILAGLWEVGRITEVQQVMWNSAREAARDASLGQDTLPSVASNLLTYLQSAEPSAFPPGHSTSMVSPVVTLPANTTGYTCWYNTETRELFMMTFAEITHPSVSDPTAMSQLDVYQLGIQVPYRSVAISPLAQTTSMSRLSVMSTWASMVDSPFQITDSLPGQ